MQGVVRERMRERMRALWARMQSRRRRRKRKARKGELPAEMYRVQTGGLSALLLADGSGVYTNNSSFNLSCDKCVYCSFATSASACARSMGLTVCTNARVSMRTFLSERQLN